MSEQTFGLLSGICLGIGLAAACGFRVFVPMLLASIAAKAGYIHLSPGWEWIGSLPALITFAVATGLEISAYYVPWLDHMLDVAAAPAAVVAGTLLTAACVGDLHPLLKWSLALIAGGGAAAVTQATTVCARVASTSVSGGFGNSVIATLEWVGALLLSLAAVLLPVAGAVLAGIVIVYALRYLYRWFLERKAAPAAGQAAISRP